MIKVRTSTNKQTNITFDPVLGHEHRPVVDGCEKTRHFPIPRL